MGVGLAGNLGVQGEVMEGLPFVLRQQVQITKGMDDFMVGNRVDRILTNLWRCIGINQITESDNHPPRNICQQSAAVTPSTTTFSGAFWMPRLERPWLSRICIDTRFSTASTDDIIHMALEFFPHHQVHPVGSLPPWRRVLSSVIRLIQRLLSGEKAGSRV